MVILYTFISEEKHQDLLDKYLYDFSEDFKNDILKYRRWQDVQLSLLGRVLLQHGLKTYYNISKPDIGISHNNKPYLKGCSVHFNISHSHNLVACVIAGFSIGIDVEFFDDKINYMDFQFQMTENEFREIHHSEDKTKSLLGYWTRKESVIKAHGSGMMIPLDSFEILNDECILEEKKFFIKDIFINKNYISCIASADIKVKKEALFFVPFEI